MPAIDNGPSQQAFDFCRLPTEIRARIFAYLLPVGCTIDRQSPGIRRTGQRLKLCLVSRQICNEVLRVFYVQNTFRVFPTTGHAFSRIVPLLKHLSTEHRILLTSLELRLGPGWGAPPRTWRVTEQLGLEEMANVWLLKVYIEIDPSQELFSGFRAGKNFYTEFSQDLLVKIVHRLPGLHQIQFDGRPSVRERGARLMQALVLRAQEFAAVQVKWPADLVLEDCITELPIALHILEIQD